MRLPLKIQVVIFRKIDGRIEFLMLHNSQTKNHEFWQNLTGGVEEGETIDQTMRREVWEETGVVSDSLKRIIPNVYYQEYDKENPPRHIKEYTFAVEFLADTEITLSHEHNAFKWCNEEEAKGLLDYEGMRISIDNTLKLISQK